MRTQGSFEFGPFRLDPSERLLQRDGEPVPLPPKAFELLVALVSRAGHLVTKEDLLREVWPGTFVEEANLSYTVSLIRKALQDDTEPHRYIETVPRAGYRFMERVTTVRDGDVIAALPSDRAQAPSRRLVVGMAILAVVALAVAWQLRRSREIAPRANGPTAARIESLAVLPLDNLSGDPAQEYFVEGIHEALITELAKLSGLKRVIARPSVRRYRKTDKPLRGIARELNVDALVTGATLQAGGRVRVTVQLIRGSTEELLWTEHYEREHRDVVTLQGEIVGAIARAIQLKLTTDERVQLARIRPVDPRAHEAYLRGHYHRRKLTDEHMRTAIGYYQQAVEIEPGFAPAHAGLSRVYSLIGGGYGNGDPREFLPKAREAARKALEIDDRLAEAHFSMAVIQAYHDWDWHGAEAANRRALELDPGDAEAHSRYALLLSRTGRHAEASREIELGRQLDPFSVQMNNIVAFVAFLARDYDRAIRQYRITLELEPDHVPALRELALVYVKVGRHAEAVEFVMRSVRLSSDHQTLANQGMVLGLAGQSKGAQQSLDQLIDRSRREYVAPINMANVCMGLDRKDQAFEWFNKALDHRIGRLANLKQQPIYDPLRGDPRFQDLLSRMNFPQ